MAHLRTRIPINILFTNNILASLIHIAKALCDQDFLAQVDIKNSEAGESLRRKSTTFCARRKFEVKDKIYEQTLSVCLTVR